MQNGTLPVLKMAKFEPGPGLTALWLDQQVHEIPSRTGRIMPALASRAGAIRRCQGLLSMRSHCEKTAEYAGP